MVGRPRASRAVGNALGANRTPLVVPCHRIVRADGEKGGFGAGPEWKERLLRLESEPGALHAPK
jgi:methylated-DNA-[protein]-cysteine S-methyltransferase